MLIGLIGASKLLHPYGNIPESRGSEELSYDQYCLRGEPQVDCMHVSMGPPSIINIYRLNLMIHDKAHDKSNITLMVLDGVLLCESAARCEERTSLIHNTGCASVAHCTLASKSSVLLVRVSACCSLSWNSLGVRMAGAKKRRKKNPLMARYFTS